jgi:hypothetical protein
MASTSSPSPPAIRPEPNPYSYTLYGLNLASDLRFRNALLPGSHAPDLTFHLLEGPPPAGSEPPTVLYPKTPEGGPAPTGRLQLSRSPDGYTLRYADVATFAMAPHRITAYEWQPERQPLVEVFFLGPVLAFHLELLGYPALHAAAAVIDGRAVAILGSKNGGKSSLAAALVQQGHALLTDDILAVELHDDGARARPAYPQMRLWPEQARHFLGHSQGLAFVHANYHKYRVPIGPGQFGTFCATSQPLACIYLPERRPPSPPGATTNTAVTITPIAKAAAVMELLRHSFVAPLVHATGRQAARLALLAQLVQQLPLRRLSYPSGLEHLPPVCDAVRDDVLSGRVGE